jgi:hypothetical protein
MSVAKQQFNDNLNDLQNSDSIIKLNDEKTAVKFENDHDLLKEINNTNQLNVNISVKRRRKRLIKKRLLKKSQSLNEVKNSKLSYCNKVKSKSSSDILMNNKFNSNSDHKKTNTLKNGKLLSWQQICISLYFIYIFFLF